MEIRSHELSVLQTVGFLSPAAVSGSAENRAASWSARVGCVPSSPCCCCCSVLGLCVFLSLWASTPVVGSTPGVVLLGLHCGIVMAFSSELRGFGLE